MVDVPGFGKGVLATKVLKPKTRLGTYTGEVLTQAEFRARYPNPRSAQYVLGVSANKYVDGSDPAKSSWHRYINSPYHRHDAAGKPLRANVRFGRGGAMQTTRTVQPGEELLVSYGPGYKL